MLIMEFTLMPEGWKSKKLMKLVGDNGNILIISMAYQNYSFVNCLFISTFNFPPIMEKYSINSPILGA